MNANVKPSKLIKGATGDWEMVIGLEVHAQVTSNSKLFSGASTAFGGAPNDHVTLVDAAMPGMLPVSNEECVAQAVRTGLGLKAQINQKSTFDRKNYFYPDLPQGYQISQYKSPIVGEGAVVVDLSGGESVTVGIERLHLEQDAGKLMHDQHPTMSFVDLNRSGVALMEIVSKPDIRSAEEAQGYVAKLRSILRYLGTCDGDMEKGNLRADVNVSVRRPGEPFGTRCEIKNMNSIRFIGQAIHYEARRQIGILEDGGTIDQETRLYDPNKGETRSMRSKEEAHDISSSPVSAEQMAAIIGLIGDGTISGKIAKDLFEIVWTKGGDPRALVESLGMKQVTDLGAIEKVVDDIIAANPDKAEQARAKPQLMGWFVGQVMKSTGGKVNPQAVNDLLKAKLGI